MQHLLKILETHVKRRNIMIEMIVSFLAEVFVNVLSLLKITLKENILLYVSNLNKSTSFFFTFYYRREINFLKSNIRNRDFDGFCNLRSPKFRFKTFSG